MNQETMKNQNSARILTANQMKRGNKSSQEKLQDRQAREVLNWIYAVIIALFTMLICNDIEDTLVHHYEQSVFYDGPESFWNPSYERVGPIAEQFPWLPRFTYDGWHLIKIIRQHFMFFVLFGISMAWFTKELGQGEWLKWYFIYAAIWHIIIWCLHWIFYDNLLLK